MEYEEAAQEVVQRLRGEYRKDIMVVKKVDSSTGGGNTESAPPIVHVNDTVSHLNTTPRPHGLGGSVIIDENIKSQGTLNQGNAKSHLYEICAANHWKTPLFECCNEQGPDHLKLFTFKVIMEIRGARTTSIECMGNPHPKKKAAAENAAEGALWFLNQAGYRLKKF